MPGSGSPRAWWRPPAWTRSENLHEWIRSGGILIATAWGMYTFIWQDVLVPSWQPANLSLEASLTPVTDRPASADGREMALVIKAVNSSSRRVYPLANIWWLSGLKREPRSGPAHGIEQVFLRDSDQALRKPELRHVERAVTSTTGSLLAVGRLVDDDVIHPGETVNRTILVRIPTGYSAVDLRVLMPVLTRPPGGLFNGRQLAWGLSPSGDPLPLLCSPADPGDSTHQRDCQPADENAYKALERFDPSKATITLSQQIGLPLPAGP